MKLTRLLHQFRGEERMEMYLLLFFYIHGSHEEHYDVRPYVAYLDGLL